MSEFSVTLTPRVSETDLLGHINNTSIPVWFEELRVRYLEAVRQAAGGLPHLQLAVASVHVDYLDEVFHGEDVVMVLREVSVGNSSISLVGDMFQGGRHAVTAKAVLVNWDPDTRRPQRVPDEYRPFLSAAPLQPGP